MLADLTLLQASARQPKRAITAVASGQGRRDGTDQEEAGYRSRARTDMPTWWLYPGRRPPVELKYPATYQHRSITLPLHTQDEASEQASRRADV